VCVCVYTGVLIFRESFGVCVCVYTGVLIFRESFVYCTHVYVCTRFMCISLIGTVILPFAQREVNNYTDISYSRIRGADAQPASAFKAFFFIREGESSIIILY
jgi:hypothetical protein